MLNALRHHGNNQKQRSSVSLGSSDNVLNALRHHGNNQLSPLLRPFFTDECSTPYGITATIRRREDFTSAFRICAQRLTASRQQSAVEAVFHLVGQIKVCSTPYGITATISSSPSSSISERTACAQRLTASRQQSVYSALGRPAQPRFLCSTPYGITATIRLAHLWTATHTRRAQRLTASRQQSGTDERVTRAARIRCAQRLTASRQQSGQWRDGRYDIGDVLNALRHHGNNQEVVTPGHQR